MAIVYFPFPALFFQQRLFEPLGDYSLDPHEFLLQTCLLIFFATLCDWFFFMGKKKVSQSIESRLLDIEKIDFALLMQALWILFYHVCYNIWSLFCWSDSLRSWDVACSVGLWTSPPSDGRRGLRCSSAKSSPSHWQQLAKCSGGSRSDSISEAGGLLIRVVLSRVKDA